MDINRMREIYYEKAKMIEIETRRRAESAEKRRLEEENRRREEENRRKTEESARRREEERRKERGVGNCSRGM